MIRQIYNHLAHKSNQINLSLAESSRHIAMDAQKDSAVMKSIAVLTMIFLPATYIAVGHSNSLVPCPTSLHRDCLHSCELRGRNMTRCESAIT